MTPHILTLVAAGDLSADAVSAAVAELRRGGATVEAPRWLAAGTACDLGFDDVDPGMVEARVREALAGANLDLVVQPAAGRRKRLLVADMESTLIRNEMLDELADFANQRSRVEDITARAMRGELGFEESLRQRVALLAGLSVDVLERALARVEVDPGAGVLVATMKAHGAHTALATGGFDVFAEPVGARLGFDTWRANKLEITGHQIAGRAGEPILGRHAKVETLEELCRQLSITPGDVIAVGDGANDLAMLEAAGLGVAFHAKPAVLAVARHSVRHGDLRTLLYYQGYGEADFVGGG